MQLRLVEVPSGPVEGYERDEEFLRKMHHVLLEVRHLAWPQPRARWSGVLGHGGCAPGKPRCQRLRCTGTLQRDGDLSQASASPAPQVEVMEGTLQCPESGRLFPISRGIPNMLLNDEETDT